LGRLRGRKRKEKEGQDTQVKRLLEDFLDPTYERPLVLISDKQPTLVNGDKALAPKIITSLLYHARIYVQANQTYIGPGRAIVNNPMQFDKEVIVIVDTYSSNTINFHLNRISRQHLLNASPCIMPWIYVSPISSQCRLSTLLTMKGAFPPISNTTLPRASAMAGTLARPPLRVRTSFCQVVWRGYSREQRCLWDKTPHPVGSQKRTPINTATKLIKSQSRMPGF